MPKFRVTSVHFDLTQKEVEAMVMPRSYISAPPARTMHHRVEDIDTDTNQLFRGVTSPWQVEDIYEAFWNRLNDSDEDPPYHTHRPTEKVKVVRVEVLR